MKKRESNYRLELLESFALRLSVKDAQDREKRFKEYYLHYYTQRPDGQSSIETLVEWASQEMMDGKTKEFRDKVRGKFKTAWESVYHELLPKADRLAKEALEDQKWERSASKALDAYKLKLSKMTNVEIDRSQRKKAA